MRAIGDNLITVARSKRYTHKQFRELFLYAIGDRADAPEGLELVAELIAADQDGIRERGEKRAALAAKRRLAFKARRNAQNAGNAENAQNAENAENAENGHLPSTPTNQPSGNNASVIPDAPAHGAPTPPTLAEVLAWASDGVHKPDGKPIPADFCREWYALMEAATPPWTNTRGRSLTRNWRQEVIYAWRRDQQFAARAGRGNGRNANQPDGVIHHEEGYENPL